MSALGMLRSKEGGGGAEKSIRQIPHVARSISRLVLMMCHMPGPGLSKHPLIIRVAPACQ